MYKNSISMVELFCNSTFFFFLFNVFALQSWLLSRWFSASKEEIFFMIAKVEFYIYVTTLIQTAIT